MKTLRDERPVLAKLANWGEENSLIRAFILTSSRARPGAPVDIFSDYDVILVVTDTEPFSLLKEREANARQGAKDNFQFHTGLIKGLTKKP